jgi:hypothetical protein
MPQFSDAQMADGGFLAAIRFFMNKRPGPRLVEPAFNALGRHRMVCQCLRVYLSPSQHHVGKIAVSAQ